MFVLSCEAATCAVPEWHKEAFRGREEELTSPAGWSPGALNLAQAFATRLRVLLAHGDMTRLLIDLGRHPSDPGRFGAVGAGFTADQKQRLDDRHQRPYLQLLKQRIRNELQRAGRCIHLSLATGEIPGGVRFERSGRAIEVDFCDRWSAALAATGAGFHAEISTAPEPDLGSHLREEFPEDFGSIRVVAARSSFLEGRPVRWDALRKSLLETIPHSA